jgi:hypothetical protein
MKLGASSGGWDVKDSNGNVLVTLATIATCLQGLLRTPLPGGDRDTENGNPMRMESTQDTTQLKRAIDMTDDELAAIVAKGSKLTVVK